MGAAVTTTTTTSEVASGRLRVPVLAIAVLVYAAAAAILKPKFYIAMIEDYGMQLALFAAALPVPILIAAMVRRPSAPIAYVVEFVRERALRLVVVAVFICIGLSAFTTFKIAIPTFVPFYADPVLAVIDAAVHFGHDPGMLVHQLLPQWAQYPLGMLYGPIWAFAWFGSMAFVALTTDGRLRRHYFWALAIAVCGIGTIAATLFSSVGPMFYQRIYGVDRFAALAVAIHDSAIGEYVAQATGYLYDNYVRGGAQPGTGISAMPSMHLAVVTLDALMLARVNRIAGYIAWAYVPAILAGSVFIGWHYAIDGYVSILTVLGIWWVVGKALAAWDARSSRPDAA